MTLWKKVLIVANCIIALGVLVFLGLLGELYYDSHYGPRDGFSASGEVDDPIYIRYFNDRTCRLYDYNKGEYITPKWEWISTGVTEDSVVVFCDKNRQRGFVNVYTGKVVIPAQYKHAWNFSEGKAAVYKDGKVWFVNKQNQPIIPTKYTLGGILRHPDGLRFPQRIQPHVRLSQPLRHHRHHRRMGYPAYLRLI